MFLLMALILYIIYIREQKVNTEELFSWLDKNGGYYKVY